MKKLVEAVIDYLGTLSMLVILAFVILVFLPDFDRAFAVIEAEATGSENHPDIAIVVGEKSFGWKVNVCRLRGGPRYNSGRGITFSHFPSDGGSPRTVYNVRDVVADQDAGSGSTNIRVGECRTYRYAVERTATMQTGDRIVGTAHYNSNWGWWDLSNKYGEIHVPKPVDLFPVLDGIVQHRLEEGGQGIQELKK